MRHHTRRYRFLTGILRVTYVRLPSLITDSDLARLQNISSLHTVRNIVHPENDLELQRSADQTLNEYKSVTTTPSIFEFLTEHTVGNCQLSALACAEIIPDFLFSLIASDAPYEPRFATGYHAQINSQGAMTVDFQACNHIWNVFVSQYQGTCSIFTVDNAATVADTEISAAELIPHAHAQNPMDEPFMQLFFLDHQSNFYAPGPIA